MARSGKLPKVSMAPKTWAVEGKGLVANCVRADIPDRLFRFDVHATENGVLMYGPPADEVEFVYFVTDEHENEVAKVEWRFPEHVEDLPAEARAGLLTLQPGPFMEKAKAMRLFAKEVARSNRNGGDDDDEEGEDE